MAKKGQKQKQRQSQSVVVNIGKGSRKPPSLQKAAAPVQRPTVVIPAADRFLPPGYSQPSLADILSALQSGTKGGVVGARSYAEPPSSLQRQSLQPTPIPSLSPPAASLPPAFGPPQKTVSQALFQSTFGLSDTVNKGLTTFLGATGRLLEKAVTPETDGSTPPPSIFVRVVPPASVVDDLARGRGSFNPLPQPPIPLPLLPTETETPLPQQTVFDLMTRPGASTVVPSAGLVPETEGLLTPQEEATFVDVNPEEEPLVVEPVIEEGPTPEIGAGSGDLEPPAKTTASDVLTPALPLLQTAASLSSGEPQLATPRTSVSLAAAEESGTPRRGLSAKEQRRARFEMYRSQLASEGRPTDDESVKDYIYEIEQKKAV